MPYETDERLKSYLDTNQMHREQMCLAVLAVDKRFSEIRPRHPRGGPDGARDIDAIFKGAQRAFGAVGFLNQANDSDESKKAIKRKFTDDLTSALKQDPKPDVFVFFTNVNLTLAEKDELTDTGKAVGLSYIEVFDRERIRLSLDSPDGLSIRFQYLGIPLSEAEQAVFFARWGDEIQGVIADGFGKMQKSLNRIMFLQEASQHLSHFTCVFELDREYAGIEIGHFRAFALVYLRAPSHGLLSFIFGATDNNARLNANGAADLEKGRSGITQGVCGAQWDMTICENHTETTTNENDETKVDEQYEKCGTFTAIGRSAVKTIPIQYKKGSFFRIDPALRLFDLEECMIVFFLNRKLAERVCNITIYSNEYKLKEINGSDISAEHPRQEPEIPLLFTDEELADPWVIVRPKNATFFTVDFSDQTPRRYFHADEVSDTRRS
jgi:hypothetical protein